MTKKKRAHPTVEDVLERPWCYYCERDFDDLKILTDHQKAKHFKCDKCGRRLNTAGGLSVHMNQVHKENLETVENALPNRSGVNVEIFGMEGIPDDVIQQHNQRVIHEYHQGQADRRAATGNPPPGEGSAAKKPKIESAADVKARLAAFKAKKAAGEVQSNGNGTPSGAGQPGQSPGVPQSPTPYQQNGPPGYQQPQYPPQGSPPQAQYSQPYGQQNFNMPPQQPPLPSSHSPFGQAPPGYPPHPQQPFPPPGMPPYQYYGQSPPQHPPYGAGSPAPGPFPGQQSGSPALNGMFARPPGLPPAPGLPSRPSFQAPPVNAQQMQQMHHGQYGQDPNQPSATEADVDELVANAAKDAGRNGAPSQDAAVPTQESTAPPSADKKGKKDRDKATRLVYEDNDISPEEKMSTWPRYAFDPSQQPDETKLEASSGGVGAQFAGAVASEDDVIDRQGD